MSFYRALRVQNAMCVLHSQEIRKCLFIYLWYLQVFFTRDSGGGWANIGGQPRTWQYNPPPIHPDKKLRPDTQTADTKVWWHI